MKQGWKLQTLESLYEITSSKRVHKSDWKGEGIPFYRAREVVKLARDGYVDNDLFISHELYSEYTNTKGEPKEGDILVSAVGTLGRCYLIKKNEKLYFKDASVLWFRKTSTIESKYVEYAFKSDLILDQVMQGSMGATVGTYTITRAKNTQIPVPPLEEQKQIVAKLDQCFEAIDKAKANAAKNLENAKELFQSKLNDIFSQKGEGWEFTLFLANKKGYDGVDSSLGMLVSIRHGDTSTYFIGVTNDEGRSLHVNYVLLWEAILYAKQKGCDWFDIGGLNAITPKGIAHFKSGMNSKQYELVGEWRRFTAL